MDHLCEEIVPLSYRQNARESSGKIVQYISCKKDLHQNMPNKFVNVPINNVSVNNARCNTFPNVYVIIENLKRYDLLFGRNHLLMTLNRLFLALFVSKK